MSEQYTIIFHDGTMGGDTSSAEMKIDSPDITWKEAKELVASPEAAKSNWCIDPNDEGGLLDWKECVADDMKGAWIIDPETWNKIQQALEYTESPGGDSAAYAQHEAIKGFYRAFAIKSIGKKPS